MSTRVFIKSKDGLEDESDSGSDVEYESESEEEEVPKIVIQKTEVLDSVKKLNELLIKFSTVNNIPILIQNLEGIIKSLNNVNIGNLSNLEHLTKLDLLDNVTDRLKDLDQ